jgi:hypothetical protein
MGEDQELMESKYQVMHRGCPPDASNYAPRGRYRIDQEESALTVRLNRLNELYLDGDLDKSTYHTRRNLLQQQIAALPKTGGNPLLDVEWAAELLGNFKQLWGKATLEEQERIFKALFNRVYVADGQDNRIEPTKIP